MARTLIVEDSPTQAEQLRAILEAAGFAVEAAKDATEGLDRFGRSAFDLVISDVVMPGLSGYDLCRRIKSGRLGATAPVILLTSLADPMDIIQGLESGADAFLTKPYEPEHLVHRVRSILESRNLRAGEKARMGIEISFLGKKFTITSEKEQILDLLISTFEDIVRTNRDLRRSEEELSLAKARLEDYSRRLEGKIEATEERYRRLVETAADAILIADAGSGTIIDANEAAARLWGRPTAELIGMHQGNLHFETPEGYCEKLFQEAVREGGSIRREAMVRRADGTLVPVEISSSVFEVQGRRLIQGIFRDLTDRKAMEARLHQIQRMEAIGRLTGGLAHDFNNLLTIILGNLQMLEGGIKDNDRQQKRLQAAQHAALRGADLTRRLLAFGRGQTLEPRVVNVNDLVVGMENMLHRTLGEDVEIVSVLARNLAPARIDPHQLENALLNLCINARDAMPSGGKLTIETANSYLDEVYAARQLEVNPGQYVLAAVTDTGIGMTPEVAERAFEPFFTTKETGQGTGLGLSQVYGFVKQSGGHAKIYSEPGRGTTVKLYFPAAEGAKVEAVAAPAAAKSAGGSESILVVEDDADVREVLVASLSELGYRITVAGNGPHALEVLEQTENIDLLLTDVVMPGGLTGPELAVRALERHPGMRVLYMSGYTRNAMLRDGKLGDDTEVLLKPFDKETLASKVRLVLEK